MTQPVDQTSVFKLINKKVSDTGKFTNLGCIVSGAENQLGGSIVTGADIRDVWLILYQDFCATKVTELQDSSARVQQKVLWLNVTMADTLRVNVCESTEELVDVELDLEDWHDCLHLVEVSRSPVDGLWDVLLYKVEVYFVLLSTASLVNASNEV